MSKDKQVLFALRDGPLSVKEIKFRKSQATLYRTIQSLLLAKWVEKVEGNKYALTEKGRRVLELM